MTVTIEGLTVSADGPYVVITGETTYMSLLGHNIGGVAANRVHESGVVWKVAVIAVENNEMILSTNASSLDLAKSICDAIRRAAIEAGQWRRG